MLFLNFIIHITFTHNHSTLIWIPFWNRIPRKYRRIYLQPPRCGVTNITLFAPRISFRRREIPSTSPFPHSQSLHLHYLSARRDAPDAANPVTFNLGRAKCNITLTNDELCVSAEILLRFYDIVTGNRNKFGFVIVHIESVYLLVELGQ